MCEKSILLFEKLKLILKIVESTPEQDYAELDDNISKRQDESLQEIYEITRSIIKEG